METFFTDSHRSGLSYITQSTVWLRGSDARFCKIPCGDEIVSPDIYAVNKDPTAPPVVFNPDGTATAGDRHFRWKFVVFPENCGREDGWRVYADRLFDLPSLEARCFQWSEHAQLIEERSQKPLRAIWEHFPDGVWEQEGLVWFISEHDGHVGIGIGSPQIRKKAVDAPDAAASIRRWYEQIQTVQKPMAWIEEVLRKAFLRHLPPASSQRLYQTSLMQVNGRHYWLRVEKYDSWMDAYVWRPHHWHQQPLVRTF